MWNLNRTHLEVSSHFNMSSKHINNTFQDFCWLNCWTNALLGAVLPSLKPHPQLCILGRGLRDLLAQKTRSPHYRPVWSECGGHKISLIIQRFWLSHSTHIIAGCVHAQTPLTSDSAIVSAPLPLDIARKDISNTNEGMRARLSLRLCPCQPVKPSLSNSDVQWACAKDHHYRSTAQHITHHKRFTQQPRAANHITITEYTKIIRSNLLPTTNQQWYAVRTLMLI